MNVPTDSVPVIAETVSTVVAIVPVIAVVGVPVWVRKTNVGNACHRVACYPILRRPVVELFVGRISVSVPDVTVTVPPNDPT